MKTNPELRDFICMVGLPGSGKSTYALSTFPNHVYLSSDTIIDSIALNVNKTYSEVFDSIIDPAIEMTYAQLELASFSKEDIVLDQVNTSVGARAKKLKLLHNKDSYWKVAIVMDIPDELLKFRLTKREASGKIIPESVLESFKNSFVMPTIEEGFDEVRVISGG